MLFFRPVLTITFLLAALMASHLQAKDTSDNKQQATAPAQGKLPIRELRHFTEIYERIRSAYVEEVDDKTLLEYAIHGMLSSLDPHSAYLQPDAFDELQESTSGKFGGLGIEVAMDDGLIRVVTPIDDTPAEQAGIKTGDLIVTLDGKAVMGMSLDEALESMRGKPGSRITLEIRRTNESGLLTFTLERAEINVTSVRTQLLSDGIGYIRITQFQEKTGVELNKALNAWQKNKQPLKALILDLRNNPGGVLGAAVDVCDAFIRKGLIVYTEGRAADSRLSFSAKSQTAAGDLPLVTLINGGSASASEIVAGALQDHKRAIIVGTRSFGKGSVQSVLPITDDKAIKLTTARYFTPKGRSIQAQGIEPDINVEQSEVTPRENRYYKEADLPGHLENQKQTRSNKTADKVDLITSELLKNDFQLYEAHTLLRGMTILSSAHKAASSKQDSVSGKH